tara:strand:+ start:230 stop:475 length:246 start_codon:yes stop_codon:yes gene_type:complete
MKNKQIQLHKEWNEDVDFAVGKLEMLITKLNQIKNQASMNGLHDLDLPKALDNFAEYELNELHNSLGSVFQTVGAVYERGE